MGLRIISLTLMRRRFYGRSGAKISSATNFATLRPSKLNTKTSFLRSTRTPNQSLQKQTSRISSRSKCQQKR